MNEYIIDKIPKEIFNIKAKVIKINSQSALHIYNEKEIEKGQHGYRYDFKKNEYNKEWIGDNYYVIGYDDLFKDPIIIDVNDVNNPVYSISYNNWADTKMISSNLANFIYILEILSTNKDNHEKLLRIRTIDPMCWNYWDKRLNDTTVKESPKSNIKKLIIYFFISVLILALILIISLKLK